MNKIKNKQIILALTSLAIFICLFSFTSAWVYFADGIEFSPPNSNATYIVALGGLNCTSVAIDNNCFNITGGIYEGNYCLDPTVATNYTLGNITGNATIYLRSEDGTLIATPKLTLDGSSYIANTLQVIGIIFGTNYTLKGEDTTGKHLDNNTYWYIDTISSVNEFNVTLEKSQLALSFYLKNSSDALTYGFISDLNATTSFNTTSYAIVQENLTQGRVNVRFNIDNTSNHTQFYEYINDGIIDIDEDIETLENADWYNYIRVYDNSNAPIQDAIVRVSASERDQLYVWDQYMLIGQRLTNANGLTFFWGDINSNWKIEVSKDGYSTEIRSITVGDEDYNKDNPIEIYMTESKNNQYKDIRMYFDKVITTLADDIEGTIVTQLVNDSSTVEWTTLYRNNLGNERYDITSDLSSSDYIDTSGYISRSAGVDQADITLRSGTDFNNSGTSNITVMIYVNGVNAKNYTIIYNDDTQYTQFNPSDLSTYPKKLVRITLWLILILISFAIGMMFSRSSKDASVITFELGLIVISFIQPIFWIPLFIIALHYMFETITEVISDG